MPFNHYLNAHFKQSECILIARARDECRNRDVCLYALPDRFDVVGVTDGVDAWIAPAVPGPFYGNATADCADIMRRLKAGEPIPPVPGVRAPRTRVRLEDDPSTHQSRSRNRVRI